MLDSSKLMAIQTIDNCLPKLLGFFVSISKLTFAGMLYPERTTSFCRIRVKYHGEPRSLHVHGKGIKGQ